MAHWGQNMLNWDKDTGKVPPRKIKLDSSVQKLGPDRNWTSRFSLNLKFNNLPNSNLSPGGPLASPLGTLQPVPPCMSLRFHQETLKGICQENSSFHISRGRGRYKWEQTTCTLASCPSPFLRSFCNMADWMSSSSLCPWWASKRGAYSTEMSKISATNWKSRTLTVGKSTTFSQY